MESLGHEVVPFDDVLCQMTDMIKPQATNGRLVLSDLLKPQAMASAGVVFDALFNLDKFISFEQRDPFAERHKRDDPFDCEWERFAFAEYNRLAAEEEAREQEMDLDPHGNGGSMGVEDWGDSM
jgi:serine/threonine-protein phosphatase 2A regulatory subunit B''